MHSLKAIPTNDKSYVTLIMLVAATMFLDYVLPPASAATLRAMFLMALEDSLRATFC